MEIPCFSKNTDCFLQRHAIIAIQEIEYKEIKKIEKLILKPCYGIYKELRTYKTPVYVTPPEAIPYKDLIQESTFYV